MLAFVLGTVISVLYIKTFQGLSYSRNFVHCLVLCPLVTAVAMQAIGDNLARGLGMVGAISLLRFRSSLKDPRDMFFLFASLSVGVACGVHSYAIGVVGTIGFIASVVVLSQTPFGESNQFDGIVRFNSPSSIATSGALELLLKKYCRHFSLVTIRETAQGERLDYAYQIKLKRGESHEQFVHDLKALDTIKGVNLMLQEATVEV
jgi:uncharacterized membrane protein YhiD involved in acid resistance